MSFSIPFLWARRIQRQAAEWHLELVAGTTPERRAEFEEWLAADPEHVREYRIFDSYSELSPELARPEHQRHRSRLFGPSYAFAVACLVVIGAALLMTNRESGSAHAAVTNSGPAVRFVKLADGSHIALDTNTSLSVEFNSVTREVELHSGRARFDIAPDAERAFIVSSEHGRVASTGGAFDVDVRDGEGRVISVTGVTRVQGEDDREPAQRMLSAGDTARIGNGKITPAARKRYERLWPWGNVWFDQAPLSEIVAMANRLGGPRIGIADTSIGAMRVTAILDLRDSRALARKLAAALDLEVKKTPDGVLLTR